MYRSNSALTRDPGQMNGPYPSAVCELFTVAIHESKEGNHAGALFLVQPAPLPLGKNCNRWNSRQGEASNLHKVGRPRSNSCVV